MWDVGDGRVNRLSFKTADFEGPLDVLLQLISRHKLDINNIEITVLVYQYLEFISSLEESDYELAGEFLEMAAHLVYLKVISLLPGHEEAEEMKKELQGRLIDYACCKLTAQLLRGSFCGNNIFVREPAVPEADNTYKLRHDPSCLADAMKKIVLKRLTKKEISARSFEKIVNQPMYPVEVKVIAILRKLYADGNAALESFFYGISDRSERVAAFLAVLELTKAGRIRISEDSDMLYFAADSVKRRSRRRTVTV